jgi:hypothetical protein
MVSVDRDGDFNFAILLVPISLLCGGFCVAWSQNDHLVAMAIAAVLTVAYGAVGVFVLREQHREDALRRWLLKNAIEIWERGVSRDGVLVRPDTELVIHSVSLSLLVVWTNTPCCPQLADGPSPQQSKRGALLTSALLGWWSLPGVMRTPFTLASTLRGGARITVHEYMELLQKAGVTSRWQRSGHL